MVMVMVRMTETGTTQTKKETVPKENEEINR